MAQSHVRTSLGDAGKASKGKDAPADNTSARKTRAAIMLGVVLVLLAGAYFLWWREPSEKNDFVPVQVEAPAAVPGEQPKPQQPGQPAEPANSPPRRIIAG